MKKHLMWLSCTLLMLIVLSACKSDNSNKGSSIRSLEVTIPAADPRTIIEGCPSADLEDWYEKNFFNMQSFVDEADLRARTAENERRNQMDFVLDRLVSLRNAVNNAATPTCVEARHLSIVDGMQDVVIEFQRFANAEIGAEELETRVVNLLGDLENYINLLPNEVDPLMQLDPATALPSTE